MCGSEGLSSLSFFSHFFDVLYCYDWMIEVINLRILFFISAVTSTVKLNTWIVEIIVFKTCYQLNYLEYSSRKPPKEKKNYLQCVRTNLLLLFLNCLFTFLCLGRLTSKEFWFLEGF